MYAIISQDAATLKVEYNFDEVPLQIIWPDKQISFFPQIGDTHGSDIFVNMSIVSSPPTSLHIKNGFTLSYDANTYTVTETVTWVEDTLDNMRSTAKTRILTWRDTQQDNGFTFANVVFQSDPVSRTSIEGAVQMAIIANMSNTAYDVSWTAMDNSQHDMDANTVIQFGVTAATAFQYWHGQSLTLKTQIDAANTAASIQTVLDSVGA